MNIPQFTAQASLYKTNRYYRMLGKFGQADGAIYPALSMSDLFRSSLGLADLDIRSSRNLSDLFHIDSPFPTVIPCGALGKACCRAPAALQNIPAFGPVVSCQKGLGCDITTNKCVSTCGGTGQVCCDGPETRATKWSDRWLYSPNDRNLREMCDTGVCDRQTHRCITCGNRQKGSCCSSDASQATARCFRDSVTGHRLVCNDPWEGAGGACVQCGNSGQPTCATAGEPPCDDGSVERESDGSCVPCGRAGLPTCDVGEPCRDGQSVPDWSSPKCVPAGGPNQPCHPDGRCDNPGYFCNSSRICQYYNYPNPGGIGGVGGGGGGGGGGVCGANGQIPCGGIRCNQGLILSGGKCVLPSSTPGSCALEGQTCVADFLTGTHCCQTGGPLLCVYQRCKACIPHGEEVPPWGTQICCSYGDAVVWDQFSQKAVCGIVSPP
jgi:hypothetical protein